MTALTHALTGAALATTQKNPFLAFGLAFSSHFLLDLLPHNDYLYFYYKFKVGGSLFKSIVSLSLLTLTLTLTGFFFLKSGGDSRLLLGALAASLPDVAAALSEEINRRPNLFDRFHVAIHIRSSIAETLTELGGQPIKKAATSEEAYRNYQSIRRSRFGKLGWLLEVSGEIILLLAVLSRLIRQGKG